MSLVPFSPPPGLNSDDTVFSAEGRWASGNNVRFHMGRAQPIGRALSQFTLPAAATCWDLFAFSRSGSNTVVYGQVDKLYVGSGLASPSDRTPAANPAVDDGWSLAAWGSTLLAAPWGIAVNGGTLYEQSGASAAAAVAGAPARIDAGILVTSERQVLAFACSEEASGTWNGLCIRGSDIEDYTDWVTTATNNAFEHILEGSGEIVCAKQVGSYIAVLTTVGLYLGQYIGDPGQAYRFDKVADGCRPLSTRAACVMGGVLYWMGQDYQLRAWAPGATVQVIPCPISRDFLTGVNQPASQLRSFAVALNSWEEIWFFYYDVRDAATEGASRYVAYSVRESANAQSPVWFQGQLERTAMIDSEIVRDASANSNTGVLGANQSEQVLLHEIVSATIAISAASIRSAGFYMDNSQRRMMIRSFIPDFEDQGGNVTLNLYVRDRPLSTATTKGPHTLTTATTKKDFRASGKIFEAEFSSVGAKWRLGKPLFDAVPMGER